MTATETSWTVTPPTSPVLPEDPWTCTKRAQGQPVGRGFVGLGRSDRPLVSGETCGFGLVRSCWRLFAELEPLGPKGRAGSSPAPGTALSRDWCRHDPARPATFAIIRAKESHFRCAIRRKGLVFWTGQDQPARWQGGFDPLRFDCSGGGLSVLLGFVGMVDVPVLRLGHGERIDAVADHAE